MGECPGWGWALTYISSTGMCRGMCPLLRPPPPFGLCPFLRPPFFGLCPFLRPPPPFQVVPVPKTPLFRVVPCLRVRAHHSQYSFCINPCVIIFKDVCFTHTVNLYNFWVTKYMLHHITESQITSHIPPTFTNHERQYPVLHMAYAAKSQRIIFRIFNAPPRYIWYQ